MTPPGRRSSIWGGGHDPPRRMLLHPGGGWRVDAVAPPPQKRCAPAPAKHLIHASATCVRQHTATSQIELPTCEQSMHVLSPCALAAANASHHAHALVPAPTAAARRPICAICPKSTNRAPTCDKSGGGAPSTAGADEAPIRTAPERRKRRAGPSVLLGASTLLSWPTSAENRANAQQWSRGRVRGFIYWLEQPSGPHGLRILGSTGCSRCLV